MPESTFQSVFHQTNGIKTDPFKGNTAGMCGMVVILSIKTVTLFVLILYVLLRNPYTIVPQKEIVRGK